MANRGRSTSPRRTARQSHGQHSAEEDDLFNTRHLEQFGRTVHATASQLISGNFTGNTDPHANEHYRKALSSLHSSSRRPMIQRSVFSLARASPRELLRTQFSSGEIEQRALSYIPEELIRNVPENKSPFSLFEGFRASLPEDEQDHRGGRRKRHGKHGSKGQKLLEGSEEEKGPPQLVKLRRDKGRLDHRLEMMGIRKTMCASEIKEIDTKIANMNTMRKVILERLAGLEQEEHDLEQEVSDLSEKLDDMQESIDDAAALAKDSPQLNAVKDEKDRNQQDSDTEAPGFMSESIYEKIPKARDSPRSKRKAGGRMPRRKVSMPVLHEHMEPGTKIRELPAHNDTITALDFDAPFGTMVTAALDDTVRVWDLSAGRCMGMLEGHLSSVRCLQVEDNVVATGSMDASIRLWDLSRADYNPAAAASSTIGDRPPQEADEDRSDGDQLFTPASSEPEQATPAPVPEVHGDAMADCHTFTLSAHVAEVTALHMHNNTLVSGSADKTLRQWDLEKGRCVQTLDVLWAAAQAQTTPSSQSGLAGGFGDSGAGIGGLWGRAGAGRLKGAEADFVGAVQVFETALACGTADGVVRLWDLRSGMVHRSLVGHTGPVTALQFDDVYLVTGSQDRSIRIWDLRTGSIHDAFAYDNPITSMQFDARRIVSAAGEDVVKVYDKADGRQWDFGPGLNSTEDETKPSAVERVRIKEGFLTEGRRDGVVGVWSC